MRPLLKSLVIIAATSLAQAQPALADGDGHTHLEQAPIGEAVKDLPLFDAHIHYKQPAWGKYPPKNIIEMMDRNGVAMGLVSSTPDEGTIKLWEYAPSRIIPELRPYHDNVDAHSWAKTPNIETYLAERLAKYPHQGIGEFHIHKLDKQDAPLFRKVIALAKERDIFLHVHSNNTAIRWLYSLDPDVKIIWAHAGLSDTSSNVYATMRDHPNLIADTSLREWAILGNGDGLNPRWAKIIFAFQDRLMIGSDTWVNSQWDRYDEIINTNRQWLALLPRNIAEKIAYKNAERLLGRKVSRELVGKR